MREYLSGAMLPEEAHAAELHINSCPLCHLALEGFEEHTDEALQAIAALNSGFLKEHFDNISPQIHLNSMAPAAALPVSHRHHARRMSLLWRVGSVAAGVLLLFGLVWALERRPNHEAAPPPLIDGSNSPHSAASKVEEPVSSQSIRNAAPAAHSLNAGNAAEAAAKASAQGSSASTASVPVKAEPVSAPGDALSHEAVAPKPAPASQASHYYQEYDAVGSGSAQPQPGSAVEPKKTASPDVEKSKPAARPRESYSEGSVEAALKDNLQAMKSADPATRYGAMIKAAQCYEALGSPDKAESLLQKVVDEAPGHERRMARRALRRMR